MKIAPQRLNAFLKSPDASARVMLIYGPDTGLVRERADQLARTIVDQLDDPFRVTQLQADAITADTARLHDEMAAMALGGGKRVVWIRGAGDSLATALAALLQDMPPTDTLLIIEAGELAKRSKLRTIAEDEARKDIAAIACYIEEGMDRRRIIIEMLREHDMKIDEDALRLLADITPPDRMALRREVEKLALYALGRPTITVTDVQEALGDGSAADFDRMTQALGEGKLAELGHALMQLRGESIPSVSILRAAQRHVLRLQTLRALLDQGMNGKDAMRKINVFWKQEDSMMRQARSWPVTRSAHALQMLVEAEAAVKRTGTPDEALCGQTLIRLARSS